LIQNIKHKEVGCGDQGWRSEGRRAEAPRFSAVLRGGDHAQALHAVNYVILGAAGRRWDQA